MHVTIVGAGSLEFTRQLMSDLLQNEATADLSVCLVDIDPDRLRLVRDLVLGMFADDGERRVRATTDLREGLRASDYVINTIQVGGKAATKIDFDIPARFGVPQTIADTHGIGGISRAFRTIPHVLQIARTMEEVAPQAWLLNYTNPMAMVVMALAQQSGVRHVGLCHDADNTARELSEYLGIPEGQLAWRAGGINHMTWFLELGHNGRDMYPGLRALAADPALTSRDPIRFELLRRFGYFVSESSVHSAEYYAWFLGRLGNGGVPGVRIGEYLYRLDDLQQEFENEIASLKNDVRQTTLRPPSNEYAPKVIAAMEANEGFAFMGNVMNEGSLIRGLPERCCVEVPCFVQGGRIVSGAVGQLPTACAALNRLAVNVQLLAVEGILTCDQDLVVQGAYVDPLLSSLLSLDEIERLVRELLAAQEVYLP